MRLRPGRPGIDFETAGELLTRLFELSQALANDYESFERALTGPDEPVPALEV